MKQILVIIIIYFIIFFIQYNYLLKHTKNIDELDTRVEYNMSHEQEVREFIYKQLQNRLKLLKTKNEETNEKLDYDDWIDYNNKNPFIKLDYKDWIDYNNKNPFFNKSDDVKYFMQIWRVIPNTDNHNFTLKVYPDQTVLNYSWIDFLNYLNNRSISNKFPTDPELIRKFYLNDEKPYSVFTYNFYDPVFKRNVIRTSIVLKYDDGFGNSGTISAGYTEKNLTGSTRYDHFKDNKKMYFLMNAITLMIAIVIFSLNVKHKKIAYLKTFVFMALLMSYIFIYFKNEDFEATFEIEKEKVNNINSGILSVSFLIGVNIFILNTLEKGKIFYLQKETSLLLVFTLIILIMSTFKTTTYKYVNDLTKVRSQKELLLNYSLILNIFIIFNYAFYIYKSK